jgi:hypothetical protein
MTSHHQPKRERRHQTTLIETEPEKHGRRTQGTMAEQGPRLTWPKQELVQQLAAAVCGRRKEGSQ